MSRSSSEVKELVNELKQGFGDLQAEAREFYDQLHFNTVYQDRLVAQLPDSITQRVPYPSSRLDHAAWQTEGLLDQSVKFHVEAWTDSEHGNLARTADKLEVWLANQWAIKFRAESAIRTPTHRHQCVSPFAPWWLEWVEFKLPKEEVDREKYRKSYSPFRLTVLDPMTVYPLTDEEGQPTIAGREFALPYVEIAKRFGKYEGDCKPLEILGEQFEFLRGGRGGSPEASDLYTKKAKVWVIDDANTIAYYCDIGEGGYKELTKEIPNPFGATSLTLVYGRYNAEAETLVERCRPLLHTLGRTQHTVDVLNSHTASIALTPTSWGEVMPPDVARDVASGASSMPESRQFEETAMTPLLGKPEPIRDETPATLQTLLEQAVAERDAQLPSPFLTNPDPAVITHATANGILASHGAAEKAYNNARQSEVAGIVDVSKKMIHFLAYGGYLNKKGQPKEANEKIYVTVTGKENTSKYRGEEKGKELEITPDDVADFDSNFSLEVSIEPSTDSQKFARYQLKQLERRDGVSTMEDLVGTVYEDVSGQMAKLEEEAEYQLQGPIIDKMGFIASIEQIRLADGIDFSQLAMDMGLVEGQADPMASVTNDAAGTTPMPAPSTDVPDVGAMA